MSGSYSSASEYVRELVRPDQTRAMEELEGILRTARRPGEPMGVPPHRWEELRQDLQAHVKART